MKDVAALIYRYLTDADFFNMYKPTRTETGGGGQLYIDFLTSRIPVDQWQDFFAGVTGLRQARVKNGPQWTFGIHSIGLAAGPTQTLRVYQRREASICIPNQNINTRSRNRVGAWTSATGFPAPSNPRSRSELPSGLAVFLIRTYDNEVWAGWFRNASGVPAPCRDPGAQSLLGRMLGGRHKPGDVALLKFAQGDLLLDERDARQPFAALAVRHPGAQPQRSAPGSGSQSGPTQPSPTQPSAGRPPSGRQRSARQPRQRTEDEVIDSLFGEDEVDLAERTEQEHSIMVSVRDRNRQAVTDLKQLYQHKCQITGDTYAFLKRDGTPYSEAHHLIPLGSGGADDPRNMIIVSPLIHRMLHYANVEGVNLTAIAEQLDGSAVLQIRINGLPYTITWHARHASRVRKYDHSKTPGD